MLFAPGVSLIFIPAGVKLLCILVGGVPAAVGIYAASIYLSMELWTELPSLSNCFLALIAVCSYGLAVYWVKHKWRINPDLSNLNYWHIILLSAAASLMNGVGLNLAYFSQGVTAANDLLSKSSAMAFGDFLGCFVVVMLFNIGIHAVRKVHAD